MRRAGVVVLGLALILVSASLGVTWAAIALQAWLASVLGPPLAALIVAGVLLLPLLALIFVHLAPRRGGRKAHVSEQIQQLFRERPMLSLVVSLAAGAVIARYPGAAVGMLKLIGRASR